MLCKAGLMKHPQVMSCIYITLFLFTMLLISRQVHTSYHTHIQCHTVRAENYANPFSSSQNEYCCRQDFLLKNKNLADKEEVELCENLNRLLLENVLPAHVAALFVGENKKNEVGLLSTISLLNRKYKVGTGLKWVGWACISRLMSQPHASHTRPDIYKWFPTRGT